MKRVLVFRVLVFRVLVFRVLVACVASVSRGREANSFFRPRENRAKAKKKLEGGRGGEYHLQFFFFFFCARPILARPEKEFASRPLETLATQARVLVFRTLGRVFGKLRPKT